MATRTLKDLAKKMADIDFAMLSTHTTGGAIGGRPMSNNRQVKYNGDSFYFTWERSRTVSDIKKDPRVSLAFQGTKAFMVAVEGKAQLIRDREAMEEHWTKDLDRWFQEGLETKGLVMIKVRASRIHYWDGEDEGELTLKK